MAATYEDLELDIIRAARDVAKDYPDIDWEDVRQELALFVIKHGKSIKLREDGGNPRWLLKRVAQTYCKEQRTQHLSMSPQYAYKPSDVKKILETAFFADDISKMDVPEDAYSPLEGTVKTYAREDENGEVQIDVMYAFHEAVGVELASDVKAALKRIKPEYREAIFKRYVLGEIPDNASWERKKLNKAINDLTLKLNSYRGSVTDRQMRKAHSNAHARAQISRSYE